MMIRKGVVLTMVAVALSSCGQKASQKNELQSSMGAFYKAFEVYMAVPVSANFQRSAVTSSEESSFLEKVKAKCVGNMAQHGSGFIWEVGGGECPVSGAIQFLDRGGMNISLTFETEEAVSYVGARSVSMEIHFQMAETVTRTTHYAVFDLVDFGTVTLNMNTETTLNPTRSHATAVVKSDRVNSTVEVDFDGSTYKVKIDGRELDPAESGAYLPQP